MSALTRIKGMPVWTHDPFIDVQTGAGFLSLLMDATAEKVAFLGCVWHPTVDTGNISIRKIHWRMGAVTSFNAASVLRVSLQNVSATAGPPYQPDGTQDQFVDVTTLTANDINVTGNLSVDRTVTLDNDSLGDADSRWLAVVFEYQTFTAADAINIAGVNPPGGSASGLYGGMGGKALLNTGSWALQGAVIPNVVLECSDGSYAFLLGGAPCAKTFSNASVSSNGAIRRAGIKIKSNVEIKIDRFRINAAFGNGCDGRFVLYDSDGTTELRSIDLDNDAVFNASSSNYYEMAFPAVTLLAGTFYRFVFLASTTTAATIYYFTVSVAGHLDGLTFGADKHWTQHDGTNWADVTTQGAFADVGISHIHDGSGGGGAGIAALQGGSLVR